MRRASANNARRATDQRHLLRASSSALAHAAGITSPGLVAFSAARYSFDPRRPGASLPATMQYRVCLRPPVLRRSLKTERDLTVQLSRSSVSVHDGVAITPRSLARHAASNGLI
jgi:hypothetical protein